MLTLLLQSFIENKSKTKFKIKLFFAIAILVLIMSVVFVFLYCVNSNQIWLGILAFICVVIYFSMLAIFDVRNRRKTNERFEKYNHKLDDLKDILIGFAYKTDEKDNNWYSKTKIIYLIKMCETEIENATKPQSKILDFAKTFILPVVTYIAGVITENISYVETISIAIIVIITMVFCYVLNSAIAFIADLILKSTSVAEMKQLLEALNDLLIRDFD